MGMNLTLVGALLPVAIITLAVRRLRQAPPQAAREGIPTLLLVGLGAIIGGWLGDGTTILHQAILTLGALVAAMILAIQPARPIGPGQVVAILRSLLLMVGAFALLAVGHALAAALDLGGGAGLLIWPFWLATTAWLTLDAETVDAPGLVLPILGAGLVPLGVLFGTLWGLQESGAWLILLGAAVALPLWPLHGWWLSLFDGSPSPPRVLAVALLPASALLVLRDLAPMVPAAVAPWLIAWAALSVGYAVLRALAHTEVRRLVGLIAMAASALVALGVGNASAAGLGGAVLQALSLTLGLGGLAILGARLVGPRGGLPLAALGGLAGTAPRLALALTALLLILTQTPGFGGFAAWWLVLAGSTHPLSIAALAVLLLLGAGAVTRFLRGTLYGPPGVLAVLQSDLKPHELALLGALLGLDLLLGLLPGAILDGTGIPLG